MSSARGRRRLVWLAALALVAGSAALAVVLLRSGSSLPTHTTSAATRAGAAPERRVPLSRADRRRIDALLDRFVPSAFARRDPAASFGLATPALRAGTTRAQWARGDLPVSPYRPRGTTFHAWHLNYAYPDEVSLDLLLHPARRDVGAEIFKVDVKRIAGRWLVDAVVPVATFSPEGTPPSSNLHAANDFKPALVGIAGRSRVAAWWFLLPAGLLGLALVIPLVFLAAHLLRRARTREPLPPLPTLASRSEHARE
ncbi:MAG TPA: hypothetical protein VFA66_09880 [Gaiellaceae bacterium]|nr:hypothetical protein [Gaiellaceae bacterium]